MSVLHLGKPSSKFSVLVSGDSIKNSRDVAINPTDVFPIGSYSSLSYPLLGTTGICKSSEGSSEGKCCMPQRYGGAIVRVSELHNTGNLLFPVTSGPKANDGNKMPGSDEIITMLPRRSRDTEGVGQRQAAGVVAAAATTLRRRGVGGEGVKRRTPSRPRAKKSSGRTSRRGRKMRGVRKENSFYVKPNGEPYEYRWSTVGGRRVLHYNGRTFKGRVAHQLWGKLKAALARTESSSMHSSPCTTKTPQTKVAGKNFLCTETPSLQAGTQGFSAVANCPGVTQLAPMSAHSLFLSSGARPKLLLDDEESEAIPEKKHHSMIIVTDEDASSSSLATSAELSWPTLRTENSELTTGESSSDGSRLPERGKYDDKDGVDRRPEKREVRAPLSRKDYCYQSKLENGSCVVEHNGWLYPPELISVLRKQESADIPHSVDDNKNVTTMIGGGTAKNSDQEHEECDFNYKAKSRAVTILGLEGNKAELLMPQERKERPPLVNPVYLQRYEEMNVFNNLGAVDEQDMFVSGEEIGGIRFVS